MVEGGVCFPHELKNRGERLGGIQVVSVERRAKGMHGFGALFNELRVDAVAELRRRFQAELGSCATGRWR